MSRGRNVVSFENAFYLSNYPAIRGKEHEKQVVQSMDSLGFSNHFLQYSRLGGCTNVV